MRLTLMHARQGMFGHEQGSILGDRACCGGQCLVQFSPQLIAQFGGNGGSITVGAFTQQVDDPLLGGVELGHRESLTHPLVMMVTVMESLTTVHFAHAARTLADTARALELTAPGFRSPPRLLGVDRTVRRQDEHHAVVAVRLTGRPAMAAVADMIEGVVVVNGLTSPDADRVRARLWQAITQAGFEPAHLSAVA